MSGAVEKRGNGKRGRDKKPRAKRRTGPPKPPPPGPGRPPRSGNALPMGAVQAIDWLRYRVPVGLPEQHGKAADRAFQTIVDGMDGKIRFDLSARLKAASLVREEVCGPVAQRFEHSGPGGGPIQTEDVKARLRDRLLNRLAPKAAE